MIEKSQPLPDIIKVVALVLTLFFVHSMNASEANQSVRITPPPPLVIFSPDYKSPFSIIMIIDIGYHSGINQNGLKLNLEKTENLNFDSRFRSRILLAPMYPDESVINPD